MSTGRAWQAVMTPEDRAVYARAGYGREQAVLGSVPAMLVIDMTYGFTGRRGQTLAESQKLYPNSCGPAAWQAVDATRSLVEAVRSLGGPVFFSRDVAAQSESNVWARKHGRLDDREPDDASIVDELAPTAVDVVIEKTAPSVFFATDLADRLRREGVQDLLVVGTTTSGCVRASVVDAFSHGFGVFVVEECVFDRAALSHQVNLFEMNQKYADVLTLSEALAQVRTLGSPVGVETV